MDSLCCMYLIDRFSQLLIKMWSRVALSKYLRHQVLTTGSNFNYLSKGCFPLFSPVSLCFPLFSPVFLCFSLFSYVFLCFPMFFAVFQCFQCFLLFSPVFSCFPSFSPGFLCFPLFSPLFRCFSLFSCFPLFFCVFLWFPCFPIFPPFSFVFPCFPKFSSVQTSEGKNHAISVKFYTGNLRLHTNFCRKCTSHWHMVRLPYYLV